MNKVDIRAFGGIVLCGGRSTRMGRPKLALPFGDELMLQRVVRILSSVVSPVVVVAATVQELPSLAADVVVARDDHSDLGPLEGLRVGLNVLRSRAVAAYVTACDSPLLRPEFIRAMIARLGDHDMAIPSEGEYHHPLSAVYRTSLVRTIESLIAANRMRPTFLLDECNARVVDVDELRHVDPELNSLRNVNTVEEYVAALDAAGFSTSDAKKLIAES